MDSGPRRWTTHPEGIRVDSLTALFDAGLTSNDTVVVDDEPH